MARTLLVEDGGLDAGKDGLTVVTSLTALREGGECNEANSTASNRKSTFF
jgi:hypothetical protein